ncbi:MAG: hypothetical protein M3015_08150 [Bacteroidota bacterium]|nr:hypothetical protein [Bacteroidota bacterium]
MPDIFFGQVRLSAFVGCCHQQILCLWLLVSAFVGVVINKFFAYGRWSQDQQREAIFLNQKIKLTNNKIVVKTTIIIYTFIAAVSS